MPHRATNAREQFIADMEASGRKVRYYRGDHFWHGPAVKIEPDEFHDVLRETGVQLGFSWFRADCITYPMENDTL